MCGFGTTGKFIKGEQALKGLNTGLLKELLILLESHFGINKNIKCYCYCHYADVNFYSFLPGSRIHSLESYFWVSQFR